MASHKIPHYMLAFAESVEMGARENAHQTVRDEHRDWPHRSDEHPDFGNYVISTAEGILWGSRDDRYLMTEYGAPRAPSEGTKQKIFDSIQRTYGRAMMKTSNKAGGDDGWTYGRYWDAVIGRQTPADVRHELESHGDMVQHMSENWLNGYLFEMEGDALSYGDPVPESWNKFRAQAVKKIQDSSTHRSQTWSVEGRGAHGWKLISNHRTRENAYKKLRSVIDNSYEYGEHDVRVIESRG